MRLIKANEDYAVGTYRNFVLVLWQHYTTVDGIQALRQQVAALAGEYVGSVQMMHIVAETAVPPDRRSRNALAAMLRDQKGLVSAVSVVQEGDGFRASMVRSIVTGLALSARPGYPYRVYATVEQAAADQHFAHADPSKIRTCVEELRRSCLRQAV